ncbi:MAG: 2-oxo acid dehydrogenase subunit E2 [Clostridia bacterium]|nr:2-oxo acid dehydrogenase subunit E2 [Clostridia bacterium]
MDFKEYIRGALTAPEKGDTVEYFKLKARVSGNVLTNAADIPAGGYNYEADITKFWEEFQKLKKERDYPISFNTIMLRVFAEGLKANPRLNAHMEYKRKASTGRLIVKEHIDVAVPFLLDSGETFPVKLRNLEQLSLKGISEEIARLTSALEETDVDRVLFDIILQRIIGFILKGKFASTAAQIATGYVGKYKVAKLSGLFEHASRDKSTLQMNELNEGTVCMTNLGSLYKGLCGNVTYAPLLFPQVFIMALGAVQDRDYAFRNEKGEVDIGTKKILPINIMFDHRIGGFNDVIPFIKKLDEIFAAPEVVWEW